MKLRILIIIVCVSVARLAFGEQSSNTNVNITISDANLGVAKKYVDIGDAYFYYEIAGAGMPVILISTDSNVHQLFFALAKNYLVVRYDLRGYGKTDRQLPGEKFLHAEDLEKLMWFLGIRKAHLAGFSTGVLAAIDFAELYPNKCISLAIEDVNDSVKEDAGLRFGRSYYLSKEIADARKIIPGDVNGIVEFINSKDSE